MADLLECLIQIKALAQTPARLARRLEEDPAGPRGPLVSRHLAERELFYQRCLRAMLASDRPPLGALDCREAIDAAPPAGPGDLDSFARRRQETVARLDRCSAADLNRTGLESLRGPITVADLVALMLAHDTDHLAPLAHPADVRRRFQ